MKRIVIFAAAALMMVACNKDEGGVSLVNQASGDAVGFSAYVSTPVTKGTVEGVSTLQSKGVGVYAFYQPGSNSVSTLFNSRNFATPDFMYNQSVTYNSTETKWEYTPIKYWPNNEGDLVSFFAYAPYEAGKAWDCMDVSTDAVASKLTIGFAIADEVSNQKDLLWADPLINQTNKKTGNINDLAKTLSFVFKHVTSKVDIEIGVAQNGTTAGAWTDENTDITVKSIVFKGLYDGFDYVYPITDGTLGTAASNNDHASKFDLTVLPCTAAATIDDNWNPTDGYLKYLDADQFMFLAPQTFTAGTETVTVTYTVKTTASDASNGSEITNAITKDMVSFLSTGISAGQAYKLKFLIGMDDVNITASTTDWDDATDSQIDIPQNE